jgi:hypothetical protein
MHDVARSIFVIVAMLLAASCDADTEQLVSTPPLDTNVSTSADTANVEVVAVTGEGGSYTFSVTVRSPDSGCDEFADWWEVLSESGDLIYRRVLLHSHVDEQPFNRTGGPVKVQPRETVLVRAHMSTTGYGGVALRGSVTDGFSVAEIPSGFGDGVEVEQPLPTGCAF